MKSSITIFEATRTAEAGPEVREDGHDLNPIPAVSRGNPAWRFEWGAGTTEEQREWLAWALFEKLGLNRAAPNHRAAFHRLTDYLQTLPRNGWALDRKQLLKAMSVQSSRVRALSGVASAAE
jgi:hypothetical protein